ncbi:MAG: rhomboid family intramembrane serine protease [Chthoniobacterales bacterium]
MTSSDDGKFWNFLGRWLPWLGTPGLLKAVVLLNALTFLLITAAPDYANVLSLDPAKIMQGEVWRLVTYIFVPETRSMFWIFFALLFLWFLSTMLEDIWGPLRLNVFYLVGMIGCTAAAFFFGGGPSNTFLNLSLFFAFATLAPDYEVFLFFIARVKIKYIAWVMAGVFGLQFLVLPLSAKMAMAASLANYLLFFGPAFIRNRWTAQRDAQRLQRFKSATSESTLHRCTTCGRTEVSHPDLDFRVTASGEEFCAEHLPQR